MKELIKMDDFGIFADTKDHVMANSLMVAKMFGKDHNKVLRDIRELDCSEEFRLSNFGQSSYKNEQGKKQPCFNMTRDGFTFLVMGYRGKKAAKFKEAYIARFNQMEQQLEALIAARCDYPSLMEAVKTIHDEPKFYHFSNEANLLNQLVLGCTAKDFRDRHGIEKGESIRPYLTAEQIEQMEVLQKMDMGLLLAVPDYHQRKRHLEWFLMSREKKRISA